MKNMPKISRIMCATILLTLIASCNNEEKNNTKSSMDTNESTHTILINAFEVPQGKLEASIKYWEDCRDFLKNQPGYISTKLHQSIKEGAKFELVNVAVWENPKAFAEASQKMAKVIGASPVEGLKANPSLYTIIRQ